MGVKNSRYNYCKLKISVVLVLFFTVNEACYGNFVLQYLSLFFLLLG